MASCVKIKKNKVVAKTDATNCNFVLVQRSELNNLNKLIPELNALKPNVNQLNTEVVAIKAQQNEIIDSLQSNSFLYGEVFLALGMALCFGIGFSSGDSFK